MTESNNPNLLRNHVPSCAYTHVRGALLVTLASGQAGPDGIVANGTNVYWSNFNGGGAGGIMAVPAVTRSLPQPPIKSWHTAGASATSSGVALARCLPQCPPVAPWVVLWPTASALVVKARSVSDSFRAA
jgi:hypothetical protein